MTTLYTVQFWANGQEDFKKTSYATFTQEQIMNNFDTEEGDDVWNNSDWTIWARSDVMNYLYTPMD